MHSEPKLDIVGLFSKALRYIICFAVKWLLVAAGLKLTVGIRVFIPVAACSHVALLCLFVARTKFSRI